MILSFVANGNLASTRYRAKLPGKVLEKTHKVIYGRPSGDVAVFSKHFREQDLNDAKSFNGKTVFDICDNHFDKINHYKKMCSVVDLITCPTETMKEVIKEKTGKDAVVIEDPYEFPELKRDLDFKRTACWFGNSMNPINVPLLDSIKIVTNVEPGKIGRIEYINWSVKSTIKAVSESNFVFVPQIVNDKTKTKSPNRVVEGLRLGAFVIASPIPSYLELKDFIYIGTESNGMDWAEENKEQAQTMIREGQKYIKKFSPERIAEKWEQALI